MPKTRAIRQVRAQRTRGQLLDAARRVFTERGFDGATIDDIAEAAGVSKGAFYFHFATKEDAFVALIHEWAASVSKRLQQSVAGTGELAQIVESLASSHNAEWGPSLLIEFWAQAGHSPQVAQGLVEAQRAWRAGTLKVIRAARRAGLVSDSVSAESAVALLEALRGGLIAQGALSGASRANSRSAIRGAVALLQPARPPLRRVG